MTRRSFSTCALVLLALPAAAAQLDTNDLLRCHAIIPSEQKLACYEALAVSAQSGATPTAESAHPLKSPTSAPTVASTSAPGTAAVDSPTPPAAANPDTEANFGLNRRQIEPQPQGLASIKSVVSQITEDRRHNITVVLDNGQTWAFIEPEPRLRPGDTVTIRHASLGSFLMLTPSHRSYRVERSK